MPWPLQCRPPNHRAIAGPTPRRVRSRDARVASKIKAEDNPWCLLATLYGVPESLDQGLRDKNRVAWNRYFAANLDEETRARLIYEKRHPAEELTPFSSEGLTAVAEAFAQRRDLTQCIVLPPPDSMIDFSNVQFDRDIDFDKPTKEKPGWHARRGGRRQPLHCCSLQPVSARWDCLAGVTVP